MMRRTIACGLLILVAAVIAARRYSDGGCCSAPSAVAAVSAATPPSAEVTPRGIPKLVDLGRTFCIPCKRMAPILAELKKEYAGRIDVEFIDVGENRAAAAKYSIRLIPTQVFLDASGKELFRHEGFFSKEDILAQWKKLGIDLGSGK